MKFDTTVVHAGIYPDPSTGAIIPPLYQTSTYVLEEVGKTKGFDYSRVSNPTRQVLENNLAAIEGGQYGISFASGLSAVDAVFRMLRTGDHVVSIDDVYGGVFRMAEQIYNRAGITFTYVDTADPARIEEAITSKTKLLWIETPTNPLMKVTDLRMAGEIAKRHGLLYGVDSTFATPYLLRPLEFGADIVVHSTTKYLSGHNQLIGGICITDSEQLFNELKFVQKSVGAVSSPFDCWLTLLGVKTLSLRMDRHSANGMAVAQYLENHSKISRTSYPGLPSHPGHKIAAEQMKSFGGMLSFELKGGIPAGQTLMNSVRLCALAESLGSVETMVTHPATMTHASVPKEVRMARGLTDGLVRISVGIEDIEDIIADLDQALAKV